MKKRRERALHLFQLTGRERAVNRLHLDKLRRKIVQKMIAALYILGSAFYRTRLWPMNDEARIVRAELELNHNGNGGTRFCASRTRRGESLQ